MYLNTVDFGSQAFGIESAAKTYFDKSPKDLKAEEAALLIGILKAPSWFSPTRNPQRALDRRNTVLAQMKKYDYLTRQQYDSLQALPMDMTHYRIQDHTAGLATYFREYLLQFLQVWIRLPPDPLQLYLSGYQRSVVQ